ncbi:Polysaccharide pyruvyl transferase [Sinomicrobium oceani]|uniref:Polysaccharide pyruvyl transferase n=1 Tax=Sinomicrobium oceani TaxID=1150368 RepID=A0A1K1QZB1_9FLAO|nr:polysaccharide pyruvyl transferase family protein [Sinomicrobium oceani]SFW65290.1 Polysaccharide pyruvyl transferase [Sinomicrobium oceani]
MKKRIAFIVATQYDNVGDLLINKCLIDELSNYADVYLDTKNVPDSFKEKLLFGTQNVFELDELTPYSFKGVGVANLFFSRTGITHVFKSPGPFGSGGDTKKFLRNILIGLIFFAFRLKSTKSFLVGNDLLHKHKLDKIGARFFSTSTEKILCRSHNNIEELKSLGIKNVNYIPDMCFGLKTEPIHNLEKKKIGISFRNLKDEKLHEYIVTSINNLITYYKNSDVEIVFFHQVKSDFIYTKELYEIFQSNKNISFEERCLEWEDLSFYNDFRLVLSNRLHVLLLGLVYEAIPIGVLNSDSKTMKIFNIFKGIGIDNLLYEKLSVEDIDRVFSTERDLFSKIKLVRSEQKKLLSKRISELF